MPSTSPRIIRGQNPRRLRTAVRIVRESSIAHIPARPLVRESILARILCRNPFLRKWPRRACPRHSRGTGFPRPEGARNDSRTSIQVRSCENHSRTHLPQESIPAGMRLTSPFRERNRGRRFPQEEVREMISHQHAAYLASAICGVTSGHRAQDFLHMAWSSG